MELLAAIRGLEALKEPCDVSLFSDSQYVVNGIMKGWAQRWRSNGWRRSRTELAENHDLWEQLLLLCEKHAVQLEWIRGHSGHPENERCYELASAASRQAGLPSDKRYEEQCEGRVRV